MRSVIEIHQGGRWVPAAEINRIEGHPYAATFEYRLDYVFGDRPDPVSLTLPVTADYFGMDSEGDLPMCPPFLFDLVPQGPGRKYLAHALSLPAGDDQDIALAQYGAFNPIGNLRLDTAVRFYQEYVAFQHPGDLEGFAIEDIVGKKDGFLEYLQTHAMLPAGTTGVQGAAPKFLLTEDFSARWHADAMLADQSASRHWLVKLPRGRHETDYQVLQNEAAYLRVAERCGLRTGAEPVWRDDMLFLQRFDRVVSPEGVVRLHQESLASLAGIRGFGLTTSLFDLVRAFTPYVSDPVEETIEFLKRDVLNLALRNPDNHARNTAVQRMQSGRVQLTPLFDFAPMYLDRDLIVRGCKWKLEGKSVNDWADILRFLPFAVEQKAVIAERLKEFEVVVANLPVIMRECGVSRMIIDDCAQSIKSEVDRLRQLPSLGVTSASISRRQDGPAP